MPAPSPTSPHGGRAVAGAVERRPEPARAPRRRAARAARGRRRPSARPSGLLDEDVVHRVRRRPRGQRIRRRRPTPARATPSTIDATSPEMRNSKRARRRHRREDDVERALEPALGHLVVGPGGPSERRPQTASSRISGFSAEAVRGQLVDLRRGRRRQAPLRHDAARLRGSFSRDARMFVPMPAGSRRDRCSAAARAAARGRRAATSARRRARARARSGSTGRSAWPCAQSSASTCRREGITCVLQVSDCKVASQNCEGGSR